MIRGVLLIALAASAAPLDAQSNVLGAAMAAGQAGERYDGYMGTPVTPSEQLRRQVAAINLRRRNLYRGRRRVPGPRSRSGCRGRSRATGIGGDGVRAAASGTWPHDQHGLQRSGAKQDGTGGEHKQSQLRSVFVGHGSRG